MCRFLIEGLFRFFFFSGTFNLLLPLICLLFRGFCEAAACRSALFLFSMAPSYLEYSTSHQFSKSGPTPLGCLTQKVRTLDIWSSLLLPSPGRSQEPGISSKLHGSVWGMGVCVSMVLTWSAKPLNWFLDF